MALMESLNSDAFYESDLSSGKNLRLESGINVNQSYMYAFLMTMKLSEETKRTLLLTVLLYF